jgi:dTDP-4-dehydrorhamnose reductase
VNEPSPEVWAGAECTFVRVNGEERDQLRATRHWLRSADLHRLAALGVRAVRHPVLWGWRPAQRARGDQAQDESLRWSDVRLSRLSELRLRPIVGLLHHGSGPRGSSFLDPGFPDAFAAYARSVARRYPWVDAYLPINEPTTTARFAGLYGWWEPHATSDAAFAAILVAQCRAIRAAIRAVRVINPSAQLIVNEDAGVVRSTAPLTAKAAFETERRWVALDLLTGRLGPGDVMWRYLADALGDDRPLRELVDDPSPPDIIGLDYYVTSDRFLDHRIERYPSRTWAAAGDARYANVELARVDGPGIAGWDAIIADAASRYGRPIALTEVALAGAPLDACAWWQEAWDAAQGAVASGVDVRGVTAWAAFGARGWERLLLERDGTYAPGLFDASTTPPAPTRLATHVRAAASGLRAPRVRPGWWRRPARVLYAA